MKTYKVTVTRDGKWWMVAIPEFDGITQARRLGEVGDMARDWIALMTEVPIEEVDVTVEVGEVEGIDVAGTLTAINAARLEADTLEAKARSQAGLLATRLAAAGIPVRDIGSLMGVSFQRAHQLVTAGSK